MIGKRRFLVYRSIRCRIPRDPIPAFLLSAAAFLPAAAPAETTDPILASWVQYVANGVEARAVTTSTQCPVLQIDSRSVPMSVRAMPVENHPNHVCTAPVPAGTQDIVLADKPLPTPVAGTPSRIVVMGDSGCRVSDKHGLYQACNNSSIWPARQVAESAARTTPELIVYTGDYIYRESACPAGNNGCKGTPWGDNQATWIVDWFQPSEDARAAAPLVITRGNHENCSRAGLGWFRYLDAHPFTGQCLDTTEPWAMSAGAVRIAVLDTNALRDARDQPLTSIFATQLGKIKVMLDGPGWIATHRPFWGFGADDDTGLPVELTSELQDAVRKVGLPENIALLISAHLHLAQIVEFGGRRPPQLVIGNSGTELVTETQPPNTIDGLPVTAKRVFYQYGFATMEPETTGNWRLDFRDRSGRVIEPCLLTGLRVTCGADVLRPR